MNPRLSAFFRLLLPLSIFLAPTLPAQADAGTIVIGQAIDLSGPDAALGRDYVAGIKTYFDALNAAGGINGKRVQYIVRDDRGEASAAAAAVTELIERERADLLFGGVGDAATQAVLNAPAFQRGGHILFAPLATAGQKTAPVLFWRPGYQQEIRHIFNHFGNLGIKNVGVVYRETPSNREAYQGLSAEIHARGMQLAGTVTIDPKNERIAGEARKLAAARPGFVLVIADTISTALFLKEYRKHDAQTFVASTSLVNLATLRELAGAKAVEWTVFSQVVPNPAAATSMIQVEHLNMMRKYRDETVSALTLEGFAAAKALARAIQKSKRGPRSALQELLAQPAGLDLGGLSITAAPGSRHLSSYLDIALFKKGSTLVF